MSNLAIKQFTIGRWTKATFLGWLLGVVLIVLLSSLLESMGVKHMQFYVGLGMVTGVSIMQWIFHRKIVPLGLNWIWYSAIGMFVPFVILDLLPDGTIPQKLFVGVATSSILVAYLQVLLLKKHSKNAIHWFWGCIGGWILSVFMVFLSDYTRAMAQAVHFKLILALLTLILILGGGIVLGIVSGIAMKTIFKEPLV